MSKCSKNNTVIEMEVATKKIKSPNWIEVPRSIMKKLGLKPETEIIMKIENKKLVIELASDPIKAIRGISKPKRPIDAVELTDEAYLLAHGGD